MAKAHFENDKLMTAGGDTDSSMEQIRELLFGNQVRDIERRFAQIEERLERQYASLSQDLDQRLAGRERGLQQSIDGLGAVLQEERAQRAHDSAHLGQRLAQLDADIRDEQADIKREFEQKSIALQDRFDSEQTQLRQLLEQQISELRGDKIARGALADMMQELAARLREPSSE